MQLRRAWKAKRAAPDTVGTARVAHLRCATRTNYALMALRVTKLINIYESGANEVCRTHTRQLGASLVLHYPRKRRIQRQPWFISTSSGDSTTGYNSLFLGKHSSLMPPSHLAAQHATKRCTHTFCRRELETLP